MPDPARGAPRARAASWPERPRPRHRRAAEVHRCDPPPDAVCGRQRDGPDGAAIPLVHGALRPDRRSRRRGGASSSDARPQQPALRRRAFNEESGGHGTAPSVIAVGNVMSSCAAALAGIGLGLRGRRIRRHAARLPPSPGHFGLISRRSRAHPGPDARRPGPDPFTDSGVTERQHVAPHRYDTSPRSAVSSNGRMGPPKEKFGPEASCRPPSLAEGRPDNFPDGSGTRFHIMKMALISRNSP